MRVVLNDKALFIAFPVDAANVDSSIGEIQTLLGYITETELYAPVCKGLLAIKKRRGMAGGEDRGKK